jgi:hypothetical protein
VSVFYDAAYLKANKERVEELKAHFKPGGKYNPQKPKKVKKSSKKKTRR